jgi:hypothetical protein
MSPFEAAKIFLGHILYVNASVKQREAGLYEDPLEHVDDFSESIKVLKEHRLPPDDLLDRLPGGYMMYAAVSAAKKW